MTRKSHHPASPLWHKEAARTKLKRTMGIGRTRNNFLHFLNLRRGHGIGLSSISSWSKAQQSQHLLTIIQILTGLEFSKIVALETYDSLAMLTDLL